MQINHLPLPYENNLEERQLSDIALLVIHCTELPDLAMAREYGEAIHYSSGTGNSGHYYIDRDGSVHCWVSEHRVAHHVQGYNARSIGIELVNRGRYPHWHDSRHQDLTEDYPDQQIDALISLIQHLHANIHSLKHITGHEDLDQRLIPATDDARQSVRRKLDPGPLFPWSYVMKHIQLINIGSHAKYYQ